MKKKIVSVLLLIVAIFCVTACGKSNDSNSTSNKGLNVKDLSIEDFDWETNSSKCNGADCYVLSLTNNSNYDIIGVDFSYKVKSGVTEDELEVYNEFKQEHEDYIEEDDSLEDVTLRGSKNRLVQKGNELTDLRFTVGYKDWSWYDYPTEEQFSLMEPQELQLGIISGNKLYIAYYNFSSKSWKLDEKTTVVDTWSNKEIAKKLDKPNGAHFVVVTDDEDEFKIYSYGFTEDMYNEYVETLKSSGFVQDDSYSSHFEGTNDGYTVEVWFNENEEQISVTIEKE